jgi:hypothetical protein
LIVKKNIVWLGILAVMMTGCGTVSTAPLDDAYYWDDTPDRTAQTSQPSQTSQANQPSKVNSPTLEVVHQQDTTITVRIKR